MRLDQGQEVGRGRVIVMCQPCGRFCPVAGSLLGSRCQNNGKGAHFLFYRQLTLGSGGLYRVAVFVVQDQILIVGLYDHRTRAGIMLGVIERLV